VLHYHIDWLKDRLIRKNALTPVDKNFWTLTGIDQFAHQSTYVVMLWLMAM
jgi:hypothetical protein